MKEKKYKGVVVPMVTPVTREGKLDVEAVERIVTLFAKAGVSPLLMGTTGEGNSVSREDGLLLVQTAVKVKSCCAQQATSDSPMFIYAGLTGNCFSEQVTQADAYTKAGADVIVATLPTYYALTEEQMENYYTELAYRIDGPLMLYNILATTHMSIPVDVVRRLAQHPNIVGLKDSERDLDRMKECIDIARDNEDFSYFCGWAAKSAYSLSIGADGIVPSTANVIPEEFKRLYDAAVSRNPDEAEQKQKETDKVAKVYQEGLTLGQSLAALKVLMGTRKLCDPWMLPPLTRLNAEETRLVKSRYDMLVLEHLQDIKALLEEIKNG
jgi:4-hydroxy-tetrahydrodipicolinate synthase